MDGNGSVSDHEASLKEIVEYAERVEVTEHRYGGNQKGSTVKKNGQQDKEKSRSSQGSSEVGRANDGVKPSKQQIWQLPCSWAKLQPFKPSMQSPDGTCREGLSTVGGTA